MGSLRAPAWLRPEPSVIVELPPGATVRRDIDLDRPLPCALRGEIRLDGKSGNRARDEALGFQRAVAPDSVVRGVPLVTLDRGSLATTISGTDLDEHGCFTLSAREAGAYWLRIDFELAGAHGQFWFVSDRVTLCAGAVPWRLSLRTGSLRLLPPDAAHPLWDQPPRALWHGPGELLVVARNAELDEASGTRFYRRLPAGKIHLIEWRQEAPPRELECEIRAGETTEVVWPR